VQCHQQLSDTAAAAVAKSSQQLSAFCAEAVRPFRPPSPADRLLGYHYGPSARFDGERFGLAPTTAPLSAAGSLATSATSFSSAAAARAAEADAGSTIAAAAGEDSVSAATSNTHVCKNITSTRTLLILGVTQSDPSV